ncbi:LysE family translocator [Xanthovirga aplysinae]|uniref:LysE family translocator n=1 Tax=Xanthovirga aplysinae TaxID=2529853 RepID=UPI0012BCA449|nr:LysE family translocator [Xanthovirga aplysinae]MTI33419.1 LysE family translocator [Xanthovirga aplysinae]
MPGIIDYTTFILTAILINITPGVDFMYILGKSIPLGRKSGVVSALGISTGRLINVLGAAFGLSILLAESAMAFNLIKYLGVIYLLFLGGKALFSKSTKNWPMKMSSPQKNKHNRIFISGLLTNILNPKMPIFFLAILPQFIDQEYNNSLVPFLILGLTFCTTGTIWSLSLALFSAHFSKKVQTNPRTGHWLERIKGAVFIAFALKLSLEKKV